MVGAFLGIYNKHLYSNNGYGYFRVYGEGEINNQSLFERGFIEMVLYTEGSHRMRELNYYKVEIDNVSLNSTFELMMDIVEFSKFIRNNGIYNIFISEFSEKFTSIKKIKPKFKDSEIFFAFDCNKVLMLWTDSWGCDFIEDYEESWENGIFHTINRLQKEYSGSDDWMDSTGHKYLQLSLSGYKKSEDVEESVKFFQGFLVEYKKYKKAREYSKKGGFTDITQLIISSNAAFENVYDYYEAMEMKAPDMNTLLSMRLIEGLTHEYKFKDYTSALLFAVMLKLNKSKKDSKGELKKSLHEIRRELEGYLPKKVCKGFREVQSDKDIIDIIQNEYLFSKIGFYNERNNNFYFSKLKIYIDASNVIHNGQRKGGKNENTDKPKIKFLEECIRSLEEQGIKVIGIYLDSNKYESIMLENKELKTQYEELKKELNNRRISVTETMKGEIADERLIGKLKDDQSCYVISNDFYGEFNLSETQRKRLINFERMTEGKYRFFIQSTDHKDIELRSIYSNKTEKLDKYEGVTSLKKIGDWPYPDKYEYFEIITFLNKHLKDM